MNNLDRSKDCKIYENKSGNLYEYGCLMLKLDIPDWSNFLSEIDESLLYESDLDRYGLENEPHITIIYGLHNDIFDDEVIELFSDLKKSEFDIKINGIDCFHNLDYDVLKMNVKSDKLMELNEVSKKLSHTSTYPCYIPHITIGYFQKGLAECYSQPNFEMIISYIDKIIYSKTNGQKIDIPIF